MSTVDAMNAITEAASRNGHVAKALEAMSVAEADLCRLAGLVVPKELHDSLLNILPRPDYQWFSEANWEQARASFDALLCAFQENHTGMTNFFMGAVEDLVLKDRADKASSLLPTKVAPIRQIPANMEGVPLEQWLAEIPFTVLPNVTKVIQLAFPDALYLARVRQRPDPVIYALYGSQSTSWFVELGRW